MKVGPFEVVREIDEQLSQASKQAKTENLGIDVPASEITAATKVGTLVANIQDTGVKREIVDSVGEKIRTLAQSYETTRANMAQGPERTHAMNAIFAQMRALGIAGKPFLSELTSNSKSPGARLAAIAILQIAPDSAYIEWLADRMALEQAFVLFHASVALLAAVRAFGVSRKDELGAAIERALSTVRSFNKGKPDQNSINALTLALRELDQ